MAMQFMDGFDYIPVGQFIRKWDSNPGWGATVTGVYSKGKAATSSSGASMRKTLGANFTTGMVGFHLWVNSLPGANTIVFSFQDAATTQVDLRMDTTGAFFFTRNGTSIGSTSSLRVAANNWYWLEIQVTIDAAAGVAKLYVGSTLALNGTSLNTKNTANAFFQGLLLPGSNGTFQFDSFHMWDSTAGDVTAFPYGEHLIDTQLANATGSNAAWTRGGTDSGNNYSQTNEANADDDTKYVVTSGANNIDSYNFPSLAETTGTIDTVAVNTIDRIDDAGPHTMDHYVKSSSATALSAGISPSSTYNNHQSFLGTDPNTSAAWTVTNWNAAEWGMKFIS